MDSRLAEDAESAGLDVVLDERADPILRHSADVGDPGDLVDGGLRGDVRIEPAAGRRDQVDRHGCVVPGIRLPEGKREIYSQLKLEGIVESPVGLCITCDRERTGPVVVGRTHMKTMDLYSSVCAVQNLWLAARAEGLGVGWVSIFNQPELQHALGIPPEIVPIAYLCIGYVSHFHDKPELEKAGWLPRLPIEELVFHDHWGATDFEQNSPLTAALREMQANIQENGIFPR